MDPLSDIFRSLRLSGGVFLDARFTAPWCVTAQLTPEDCRAFLPKPASLIAYHVVTAGEMLVSVGDAAPIRVRAGEIALLPRNDRHEMASAPGIGPVTAGDLIQPPVNGGLARIEHGQGGAETRMVCGFLASEDQVNPLLGTLPHILTLDVRKAASRPWIEASVRFAADALASGQPAGSDVLSRLSELLLVEAVRHYAASLAGDDTGWVKGLADPQIGRALALIHRNAAEPWSAETLGRKAGLSRSAFVDRFRALVGVPPIRYLTRWRLQTARLQLRESRKSVSQLAHAVGYESEEAFSRAFKREFGLSPARWREQSQAA